MEVERNVHPEKLEWEKCELSKQSAYPISVKVRHCASTTPNSQTIGDEKPIHRVHGINGNGIIRHDSSAANSNGHVRQDEEGGKTEVIRAKYLIGCDGAHSWTRSQVGLSLEGEQTDHIWAVMDILPLTNFPDIRQSCAIHSSSCGSVMIVPRERKLVRFYIQMSDMSKSGVLDRSRITPETMLEAAQKIMTPYKLRYKYCEWWSVYQIGQRVAPKFSINDRIFLAGDAVHTHSPKLGQGLNVSMHDTYNLGWKICSVINGTSKPEILSTYHPERHQVALHLMNADHETSEFYSDGRRDRKDFQSHREKFYEFLSGTSVTYGPSLLVAGAPSAPVVIDGSNSMAKSVLSTNKTSEPISKKSPKELASRITLGARLPSYKVINQFDASPTHLASLLPSTGAFRILLFAGDLTIPSRRNLINTLGAALASPSSFLALYNRPGSAPLIEIFTIHSSPRAQIEPLDDLHDIFHPWDEDTGWDYGKIFADDVSWHEGFADAYRMLGVGREEGCCVVVRPDQHVGCVCEVDDVEAVERYFAGILRPRRNAKSARLD